MRRPVCYDITRLLTRIVNASPNGIDRIDHALAGHFLGGDAETAFASAYSGVGSRLLTGAAAREAVDGIAAHWGEIRLDAEADPVFRQVRSWLAGEPIGPPPPRRNARRRLPLRVGAVASWIRRHGRSLTATPQSGLPQGSVYLNVSQFPLWISSPFEWLETRRDVRAAFFVHDLLPIELPEYFRVAELERHRNRMRNVARFASAAIVTTRTVEADLRAHLAGLGRDDLPIFVAATPISPIFAAPRVVDPALAGRRYFVLCSTLEPRKNHLMVLAAWRALARTMGRDTPKLVLVGTRGWHYAPIIDLIERAPALREHVREVGGLSTPGLKRLVDNAEALLMPSFGEGYGLPVHEALAAGTPVVASDIPAFREIDAAGLTRLSPLDGEAWLAAIEDRARQPRTRDTIAPPSPTTWSTYFDELDAFVARL